jgi:two-component system response regulator YesN
LTELKFIPNSVICEVEQYLNSHIKGKLPVLKALAQKFSISESTLKRQFKKRLGVNISNYFINKKMEYAKQIMRENSIGVTDAAHIVGYTSVHNFITMFKKHYGVYLPSNHSMSKRA